VAARITPWYHEDDVCWIAECTICLREMPDIKGGIWTPGAAMGSRLIKRLVDHAGITFEVER